MECSINHLGKLHFLTRYDPIHNIGDETNHYSQHVKLFVAELVYMHIHIHNYINTYFYYVYYYYNFIIIIYILQQFVIYLYNIINLHHLVLNFIKILVAIIKLHTHMHTDTYTYKQFFIIFSFSAY